LVEITLLPTRRKLLAAKGETVLSTLYQGRIDVSGSSCEGKVDAVNARFALLIPRRSVKETGASYGRKRSSKAGDWRICVAWRSQ